MTVRIEQADNNLLVYSQYNPAFVRRSHNLGGKWNDELKAWIFDSRDEMRIRKLCIDVYGTDGSPTETLYTIQAKANIDIEVSLNSIYFAGHQIARAWGRDSGAKLGEGVLLLEGEIGSGGSRNYWLTRIKSDSVIEIKDLTQAQVDLAKKSSDKYKKWEITLLQEQVPVKIKKDTKKVSCKKAA
jgi:hypothetical protein